MQQSRRILRFCRCPRIASIASDAPRRWSPESWGRGVPSMAAAATLPDELPGQLSRFSFEPWSMQPSIEVLRKKKLPKLDEHLHFPSATTKVMNKAEMMMETEAVKDDGVTATTDGIYTASILKNSSHRDGAIYKGNWEECYLMDIADRKETWSEREMQSDDVACYPDQENCRRHRPSDLIQIFSLRLAKTRISSGSAQLYGYLAVRDDLDGLLNYVFNRSRDDAVIVQQGSLIEMSGPKRAILMLSDVLIEFDIKIKNGEKEEDDLQLIDGLIHYEDRPMWWRPFTHRINGNAGAVDMFLTLVYHAVEAAIQVDILEVHSAFDLSLTSFVSIMGDSQEIQLFHGTIGKAGAFKRSVALPIRTMLHLKLKAGEKGSGNEVVHYFSFNAKLHGCADRQIKLQLACILVKVSWWPPLF